MTLLSWCLIGVILFLASIILEAEFPRYHKTWLFVGVFGAGAAVIIPTAFAIARVIE